MYDTLQAVKNHKKVNILDSVGNADISHVINIPFVKKIAKKFNLELDYNTQRDFLISLGILKGDRVVILSENRPEWQIADLAIMSIGGIAVPAYTTSTTSDYKHIINH